MGWAARFLTAVSFLAAGVLFAPDALRLSGDGRAAAAARLVHLLAFATAWGAGLWVTFIGGIVMFNGGDGFRRPETSSSPLRPLRALSPSSPQASPCSEPQPDASTDRPQDTALVLSPNLDKV
ncbi:hypothetical protein HU200_052408 [Digitaria exilis]|uniref:Uncharacterized protein n=1 Tax=Digitaria exilis TaxID=1010633 RepID=A0A835AL84_9POAL|nr:hypothetical protein HU200_052408 [Digitaria exilis]